MDAEERERSHLSQREAVEWLGVSVRRLKRLVRAWKRDGGAGRLCELKSYYPQSIKNFKKLMSNVGLQPISGEWRITTPFCSTDI